MQQNTTKNEETKCQLASIIRSDVHYPITYEGSKIITVGNEIVNGFRLTYGNSGKLARVESPSQNPGYLLDLFYNDEGKVSIEKNYEKYVENWRESSVFLYMYTNGRATGIRETVPWATPALEYDHEIIWEGDNIRTITIRAGTTTICTKQFSYDMTQKNPMTAFIDLYYSDNLGSSFKMPLYLSANRLIKEETNCPSVQTTNIIYELNDKSLLQKVYADAYLLLSYSYECR